MDDDGGFAGYVIWHPYDDVSMELGWVLDRSRWGRGYAGELTRLLTDRAGVRVGAWSLSASRSRR